MTFDRVLSVLGLVVAVAGLVLTGIATWRARRASPPTSSVVGDVVQRVDIRLTAGLPRPPEPPHKQTPAEWVIDKIDRGFEDFQDWLSRLETPNMFFVLFVMFGVFLFLDVLFLRVQHLVAVIIAVVAVTLAVLTMTSLGMAIKAGFSLTGPAGALLSSSMITAAAAASLPHLLTAPIWASGRYHNVTSDLVPHASIVEQGKALMLIYDTGVVFHLMWQAIGTIVVGAAMLWSLPGVCRICIHLVAAMRRSPMAGRASDMTWAGAFSRVAFLAVFWLFASGIFGRVFAFGSAKTTFVPPLPPKQGDSTLFSSHLKGVGLLTKPDGVSLLINYCHAERLLRVETRENGRWSTTYVNSVGNRPPEVVLPQAASDRAKVTSKLGVRLTTTRHYPEPLTFLQLPQLNSVISQYGVQDITQFRENSACS